MKPAFSEITKIPYEGPKSKNPLAFKHYNAERTGRGQDHEATTCGSRSSTGTRSAARCAIRSVRAPPFARGTTAPNSIEMAQNRVRVAFEFIEKLGAPFYAFHDRDVAPEGKTLAESNKNLDAVVKVLKEEQERTGIKLLWGTANLFSNPRYVHGAATSCNADVFAYAAAQVKKAIEVTHELGGAGYIFWGGREGYSTL